MSDGIDGDAAPIHPPSGQPPRVLAAWISDAIGEVRSEHLPRLTQLRFVLEAQAWNGEAPAQAFHAMLVTARGLDLEALGPLAWWRRVIPGRHRAGKDFQAGYDAMLESAAQAKGCLEDVARDWRSSASAARKAFVELELEHREISRVIEQAVHWLSELTGHLMAEVPGGQEAQSRKWAAMAQDSTLALKHLHVINDLVGEVNLVGHTLLERRTSWLDQLRKDLEAFDREWCPRVGPVALGAVGAGKPQGLQGAAQTHAQLLDRWERTDSAVAALKIEAQALEQLLARLGQKLAAS